MRSSLIKDHICREKCVIVKTLPTIATIIVKLDGVMTPLNFRIYEQLAKQKGIEKNLDCITFLTDFDKDKLTLKRNEINVQNYDILYNGKPFRIAPKAFSGIVKRSKCFKREKKVKIKDPVVSMQLWHVFHTIEELVRLDQPKRKNFVGFWSHIIQVLTAMKGLHPSICIILKMVLLLLIR